jgi:hypothetical protein
VPLATFMKAVQYCPTLTTLFLEHPLLTVTELAVILKSLPHLQQLTLHFCLSLTSLTCFTQSQTHSHGSRSSSSIASSLRRLHLNHCRAIPTDELYHLASLQLDELKLTDSLTEPLCKFVREAFNPISRHLLIPSLNKFEYHYAPDPNALR